MKQMRNQNKGSFKIVTELWLPWETVTVRNVKLWSPWQTFPFIITPHCLISYLIYINLSGTHFYSGKYIARGLLHAKVGGRKDNDNK